MRARLPALVITAAVLAAITLMWSGRIDRLAGEHASESLERSLISYALARTLNGVISVAQGTELAFQPAGVGVVLTAGEILDPLNDLVERFSWLVLMAAVSLGLQMLLTELFATTWANVAVTVVLLAAAAWAWRQPTPTSQLVVRAAAVMLLVRFAVVAAALASSAIAQGFLAEREAQSVAFLSQTTSTIEAGTPPAVPPAADDSSMMERFNEFLDDQRSALDVQARLNNLQERVESAIGHVINLIVIYLVQTIVIPVGVLVLVWMGARQLLRGASR